MTTVKLVIVLVALSVFTLSAQWHPGMAQDATATPSPSEQVILIGGATGRTGYRIVQLLVQHGYTVRGMTRDVASARDRFGSDIQWVEANVTDPESLSRAFDGVDKFISAIGTESRGGDNGPEQIHYLGMINMVDAAKKQGVKYFSLISSGGVTKADEYINRGLSDAATWRFKGEEYLRASGLDYTIVRAAAMRDFPAGENGILLLQKDEIPSGLNTRSDVAAVMVECVGNPNAVGKTFAIVNYIALDPQAWRDELARLEAD